MTFLDATSPNTAKRHPVMIRDVVVIRVDDLIDNDPLRSRQATGMFRKDALTQFRRGDSQNYVFWYVSVSGKSHPLEGPDDIDWNN